MCKIIAPPVEDDCNDMIDNLLTNAINLAVGICFLRFKNIISIHSANKIVLSKLPAIEKKIHLELFLIIISI